MSSDESSDHECPLCMEPFDPDDKTFYPCQCHYQICRFCWHRLRTDENGLCPACRQPYPENPVNFQPVSGSEMQKGKSKTKQRQPVKTKLAADARKHLAEYRVLQKNLVYVVGLSHKLADAESLKKPDYFGRFGKILKVVIGSSASTNGSGQTSVTAYVTYAREEDALRAIAAVNNLVLDNRVLRVSLGTTKYCSTFLRGQVCTKTECMYLHDVAEEEISFTKEDMHAGKHNDYERKLLEQLAARTQGSKSKAITPVLQPRTEPSTSLSQTDLSSIASSTKENDVQSEGSKKTRKAKLMADAGSRKSSPKPDSRSRPTSRASSSASFASSKSQGRTNVEEIPQETRAADEWNPPPSQPASAPEAQPLAEAPEPQKAPDSVMTTCGEFERRMLSENPVTTGAPIRENGTNGHSIDDDDLGFDPYSISAKALADMLIEEKEQGSPKFSSHEHAKPPSPPTSAKLQHMGANRSTITLDDIFTASRTSVNNASPYANLNVMPTANEPQGGGGEPTTNGHPPAQPRLFQRQSTAPHMPPQPQYYGGHHAQQQQQPKFHAEHHEPDRAMLNGGGGGYNLQMHEAAHADYLRLREFAAQVVGGYRPDQPYVVPHPAATHPRGDAYGMGPTYAPNGYAPGGGNTAPNGMERYEMHYDPMQQQRKPPYAQNKPNGALNMNECREEFKALLPNVNVRFVSSDEPGLNFKHSVDRSKTAGQSAARNSIVNLVFNTYSGEGQETK